MNGMLWAKRAFYSIGFLFTTTLFCMDEKHIDADQKHAAGVHQDDTNDPWSDWYYDHTRDTHHKERAEALLSYQQYLLQRKKDLQQQKREKFCLPYKTAKRNFFLFICSKKNNTVAPAPTTNNPTLVRRNAWSAINVDAG